MLYVTEYIVGDKHKWYDKYWANNVTKYYNLRINVYNTETDVTTVFTNLEKFERFRIKHKIQGVTKVYDEVNVYVHTKEMIALRDILIYKDSIKNTKYVGLLKPRQTTGTAKQWVLYESGFKDMHKDTPIHTIYQLIYFYLVMHQSEPIMGRTHELIYIENNFLVFHMANKICFYEITDFEKLNDILSKLDCRYAKQKLLMGF